MKTAIFILILGVLFNVSLFASGGLEVKGLDHSTFTRSSIQYSGNSEFYNDIYRYSDGKESESNYKTVALSWNDQSVVRSKAKDNVNDEFINDTHSALRSEEEVSKWDQKLASY